MSCPFNDAHVDPVVGSEGFSYGSYLQIDGLLECLQQVSDHHDEHLFITAHQVYELWFKQIIHEFDSVRKTFNDLKVQEREMLVVVARLDRVSKIFKILVDQMMLLETIKPLDFMEFRGKLAPASGFQSVQFRLLENKFGVKRENRIRYNNEDYKEIFKTVDKREQVTKLILDSENGPSLFDLVEKWLERTPGLAEDGFNFWKKFGDGFNQWIADRLKVLEEEKDPKVREVVNLDITKLKENFQQALDEDSYNFLRARGDRRLTWKAFQGAMMIYLFRNEVLFHQPFQFLNALMDIDSLLTKWRYNHVMLVQRQLGSKVGTGGTSGYQYLRSTVSDRYKAFLDLFNLSNYLIPAKYVPKLDRSLRMRLTSLTSCNGDYNEES